MPKGHKQTSIKTVNQPGSRLEETSLKKPSSGEFCRVFKAGNCERLSTSGEGQSVTCGRAHFGLGRATLLSFL